MLFIAYKDTARSYINEDFMSGEIRRKSGSKGQASPRTERGLEKAVRECQVPVMQFLGRLAIKRLYSQESLAKAFNKRFNRSIMGSNVAGHFSRETRPSTIHEYAELLGVKQEHLDLIEGKRLSQSGLEQRRRIVLNALDRMRDEYDVPDLPALVQDLWVKDPELERKSLEAHALAAFDESIGMQEHGSAQLAFFAVMQDAFDFKAHHLGIDHRYNTLWLLRRELGDILSDSVADAHLQIIVESMKASEKDITPYLRSMGNYDQMTGTFFSKALGKGDVR